ncbi:MAG: 2TM domain-containing protein [Winogradskyella sp.]|uniref:2TM domain-containing protein n=1 Tax=Winogradskyella sp. TaxID=1883156 RepID=UPI0025E263EE|nr:2TM domain-containing protein [Winogradskyella sp.]NRB83016.1 2TM domain-containing protein [Winogradskyella sp.]
MDKYSLEPYKDKDEFSDFRKEEAYMRAKKKVDSLIGFYWHFAVYVVVNVFLIILIGVNAGFDGFGPYATATFWGIGLLFHFLGVFGTDFFFGKDWEKRKVEEFMDRERQNWD